MEDWWEEENYGNGNEIELKILKMGEGGEREKGNKDGCGCVDEDLWCDRN